MNDDKLKKSLQTIWDKINHHTEDDECIVFSGDLDESYNLLEQGGTKETIKGIGKVTISVFTREGGCKPHFHVYTKNKNFHSCIRLDKAEYFVHPGKTSKFNTNELEALVKILKTKTYVGRGEEISIWENLTRSWNLNSENKIKVEITEMPNYLELK